jgi:hypothetical protein
MAAHVLRATTATPPTGLNWAGDGLASISTTRTTPGTLSAAVGSKLTILPPYTGGRATTA